MLRTFLNPEQTVLGNKTENCRRWLVGQSESCRTARLGMASVDDKLGTFELYCSGIIGRDRTSRRGYDVSH